MRAFVFVGLLCVSDLALAQRADVSDEEVLAQQFRDDVVPFLSQYCLSCHGAEKQEGKLDLRGTSATLAAVAAEQAVWEIVLQRLEAGEMPPPEADPQPAKESRDAIIQWVHAFRAQEASRNAGDPGIVLARRLSNAEYDYTIRDLTGVDIRPTKEFPVDPANGAGFDNSGESLSMSPALLQKYLVAARDVADHLALTPEGFIFAPHPMISETDRDKFCVQRIVDFYSRHQVDYAKYFLAAWRYRGRSETGREDSDLKEIAQEAGLSSRYLETIWSILNVPNAKGPVQELQLAWENLPAGGAETDDVRARCEALSQQVIEMRKALEMPIDKLHIKGSSEGSQPLILWWNRQIAENRMSYVGDRDDAELADARDQFCAAFPSAFSVSSRGHYADAELGANVRLLSAGFHLMQGYFRDDQPLYELILNEDERRELDELWQELNFITLAPMRQYKDFLFFERAEPPRFAGGPEFDFARPEDKDVTSAEKLARMRDAYLKKAEDQDASPQAMAAVTFYFEDMNREFRWIEQTRSDSEPKHLTALVRFAERAWRRPMSSAELDDVVRFYRQLCETEGLSHDEAIRDSVASILVSPKFSYRFVAEADQEAELNASGKTRALTSYELASRLSYFLWSSMPDDELLSHAASDELKDPAVLTAQAHRMLNDSRARGLATEFLGNWLEIRRFEEHNSVDRERFPEFTAALRSAMFEEPLQFFMDLVHRNGSILELVSADHTFVNRSLARHYGAEISELDNAASDDIWIRFDRAGTIGRGGLLPMAVFLTKNSPGLRTSPVKRGYWVVRRLLGERIPPPPPNVPELPADEARTGELTLAELLKTHREHSACAGCHQRFDSIGLVFEGYGPIGEHRDLDLGGRPVQTQATFPDGSAGEGLEGLRHYLTERRQSDFVDQLVRSLYAYALGRSLQLSDTAALESAKSRMAEDDFRIRTLIESIITSPQFVSTRVR